jgi:hypothetical protein
MIIAFFFMHEERPEDRLTPLGAKDNQKEIAKYFPGN